MPPAAKRDCGLVLFDLASSKKAELLNGLIKFSTFRWFMNSKSMYRLILVNSALTCNDKNYPNIFTTGLHDFDPKTVTSAIENAKPAESNWLDALLLAIYHLEKVIELPGIITLQLIFFTSFDLADKPISGQNKVQRIVDKLNEHNIFLYIIGPNIKLPATITTQNQIPKVMKDLQVDESNPNLVIAKRLVTSVKYSVMCNTKIGVNLLVSFRKSQGTQPWKVPFTFGSKLAIPVATSKIYRKDISLKMETPGRRNYIKTLADQREIEIEPSEIVKGITRHGKFVKVDDEMFKSQTERCLEIIGFTDKKFLPETYLCGEDTFYVLPSESTYDGFQAFTHLVKILAETNKYAISKRVYAKTNKPRYFVLIPNLNHVPKCFTMTGLPYSGALRPHKWGTPNVLEEDIEQDDFFRFFKSLDIDSRECKAGITLGPTLMIDFYQHNMINATAKKYLERDDLDLESLNINDHELPPDNNFLESLRQSWPERTEE